MRKHEFGGDWTTEKLERLRKYLRAYTRIFSTNRKAQYFTTIYVDAFAGSGHRSEKDESGHDAPTLHDDADPEADSYKKGSARIALEVEPPFNRYVFVEASEERARELMAMRSEFTTKKDAVRIERGDANAFLKHWCTETDWNRHRAVVFLDPYGMQVDWETLRALARTKAVDLWMLFPLGVAVNRLLTSQGPPPAKWADALTRIFGTEDWRKVFYPSRTETTLFGADEIQRKDATLDTIGQFFLDRLRSIFTRVAPSPFPLLNSMNTPIYLLCFAAGNPRGAPTAVKIAQNILKR